MINYEIIDLYVNNANEFDDRKVTTLNLNW
jgi:hypothetical protein